MSSKSVKKQTSEQSTEKSKTINRLLWVLVVLTVIAAAVGNLYLSDSFSTPIRVIGIVVLMVVGLGLAALTNQGHKAITFFKESRIEMRKVIWPKRAEATQTTLIVLLITVITSLILWGLDSIIIAIISFITSLRF